MGKKETAAERRAREAQEAQEAQALWERQKPARLVRAMALATNLAIPAKVYNRGEVLMYRFDFKNSSVGGPVSDMTEWDMFCIEQDLCGASEAIKRERHLREVRAQTLASLTDEQKEALGLA